MAETHRWYCFTCHEHGLATGYSAGLALAGVHAWHGHGRRGRRSTYIVEALA